MKSKSITTMPNEPMLKMNLQHFASPGDNPGEPGDNTQPKDDEQGENPGEPGDNTPPNDQNKNKDERLFTRDEMASIVNAQVQTALEKAKEKEQEEEDSKTEAERLAGLTEQERLLEELKAEREEMRLQKEEFAKKELDLEKVKYLQSKNLDSRLADFITGDTAEKAKESVDLLSEIISSLVKTSVEDKLTTGKPANTNKSNSGSENKLSNEAQAIIDKYNTKK